MTRSRIHRLAYPLAALLILASTVAPASARTSTLRAAFADAAREHAVPESVLLAVSYTLTRWESPGGASGAFGPMQLLDAPSAAIGNARGDDRAPARGAGASGPRALAAAAAASGTRPERLRTDPAQNVRGGAALLARYARETTGGTPADAAKWYGAVARFSGSDERSVALGFADAVFATIATGASRTTSAGETITLRATAVTPDASTAGSLALAERKHTGFDCPKSLTCRFIPAAYHQNSKDPGDYGSYDLARREADGLSIRFVIVHDAETDYATTIKIFQDPLNYVSAHYVIRASDGQVTQMVDNKNVGWHAGNWWVNMHAIGYEHEGFAIQGSTWYTDEAYSADATLTRHLAARYGIPLDRGHIIGHDEIPGPTAGFVRGMHWDPGPFWDWARYFALLGAPLVVTSTGGDVVTIAPEFATNRPAVRDCDSPGDPLLASQPANFVYLHTAPSLDAPLFQDPGLGASSGTRCANDWGDKAVTGQRFAVAERSGDWVALWYAGHKVWLHDPGGSRTLRTAAPLVTPKAGLSSIPVYGRAYAESAPGSGATLTQYSIPAGQRYSVWEKVRGDYYEATTYDALETYRLHTTATEFYLISFNHRLAFLKASDVDLLAP